MPGSENWTYYRTTQFTTLESLSIGWDRARKKCWRVKGQIMEDIISSVKEVGLDYKGSDEPLKN